MKKLVPGPKFNGKLVPRTKIFADQFYSDRPPVVLLPLTVIQIFKSRGPRGPPTFLTFLTHLYSRKLIYVYRKEIGFGKSKTMPICRILRFSIKSMFTVPYYAIIVHLCLSNY